MGNCLIWGFVVVLAVWAALLGYMDARWQLLPDRLTLPGAVAVGLAAVVDGHWKALFGGAAWAGVYLLLGMLLGGVGGGDVKLALSLGTGAAWAGGVLAVLVALFLAPVVSLCEMFFTRRKRVAHGPAMLLAAAGGLVLTTL